TLRLNNGRATHRFDYGPRMEVTAVFDDKGTMIELTEHDKQTKRSSTLGRNAPGAPASSRKPVSLQTQELELWKSQLRASDLSGKIKTHGTQLLTHLDQRGVHINSFALEAQPLTESPTGLSNTCLRQLLAN